jgi:hypothetical protein
MIIELNKPLISKLIKRCHFSSTNLENVFLDLNLSFARNDDSDSDSDSDSDWSTASSNHLATSELYFPVPPPCADALASKRAPCQPSLTENGGHGPWQRFQPSREPSARHRLVSLAATDSPIEQRGANSRVTR